MNPAPLHEILIADDDASVRDMLTRAFARDFRVLSAADGSEAMRFLERGKPAAVIVDEMMPGATGTEVLERAKSLFPDVPRVLMTASSDTEKAMKAINQGEIHRFYGKPLRVMEVRRAILDLVERAANEEALRIELRALRAVKETSQVSRAATRVVILGSGETSDRGDRVEAAAKVRGFHVVRVMRAEDMPATLMQGPADVVILCAGPGVEVATLAKLAHSIDEATAVMIVDAKPSLAEALLAVEVGAVDYIAEPYPDDMAFARRIERAASGPRATRDMRRLTFDLIVANRELTMARRRVEDEQVGLLNAMIRALEARDEYTAGHTDRVAAISVRCGQVLGMLPDALDVVRLGALLHDIGKIGIRDAVLLKPSRLTSEEFDTIKTHTTIGAKLLGDVEQFQCILPIVRGHHEKLDGTGYPDGLKGAAIPLEVRVVSASDVLDALTSTRPYRRGSHAEEAFDIMAGAVGKHLDPVVVDALKQVHKDGRLVELLQPGATEGDLPAPYRE
jgi:putative nucleotidyltransferase with HDIG domain